MWWNSNILTRQQQCLLPSEWLAYKMRWEWVGGQLRPSGLRFRDALRLLPECHDWGLRHHAQLKANLEFALAITFVELHGDCRRTEWFCVSNRIPSWCWKPLLWGCASTWEAEAGGWVQGLLLSSRPAWVRYPSQNFLRDILKVRNIVGFFYPLNYCWGCMPTHLWKLGQLLGVDSSTVLEIKLRASGFTLRTGSNSVSLFFSAFNSQLISLKCVSAYSLLSQFSTLSWIPGYCKYSSPPVFLMVILLLPYLLLVGDCLHFYWWAME